MDLQTLVFILFIAVIVTAMIVGHFQYLKRSKRPGRSNIPNSSCPIPPPPKCPSESKRSMSRRERIETLEALARIISTIEGCPYLEPRELIIKIIKTEAELISKSQSNN